MSKEKKIVIGVFIWWLGTVVTYGHCVKQFSAEEKIKCAEENRIYPNWTCDDMSRFDATFASFLWPLHWSEVLWKSSNGISQ